MFAQIKTRLVYSQFKVFLASVLCLALAACNQEQSATSAAMAKTQTDMQAAQKTEATLAAMSSEDLRELANVAFREQRLYAPVGNNALEYYLAIRKKSDKPDALTESALMDLAPYTVIATEQAINRLDFNEASRLHDLIAAIDSNVPALPRINRAIADGLKNAQILAATETKRQQEISLNKQALLAAEQAPSKTELESFNPITTEIVTKPAPLLTAIASAPTPIKAAPIQTPVAATIVTPPVREGASSTVTSKKAELIAIRTPDPGYPSDARNRGLTGAVEIEFIVLRSGEVSEVRIVNSSQRIFERNVMTTVKRWKFGPLDEPMTVRRSFNFNNPS